jgi:hypothetical protein
MRHVHIATGRSYKSWEKTTHPEDGPVAQHMIGEEAVPALAEAG